MPYAHPAATEAVDINEADERMKRYYGIIPRDKPAEIRTVRIVKRESEKRQRDKTKRYDDYLSSGLDDLSEEESPCAKNAHCYSDVDEETIMSDPVLSQFSHVLTLPRRKKEEKRLSVGSVEAPVVPARPRSMREDQCKEPLSARRNLASLSLNNDQQVVATANGNEKLESWTQRSPVLTPVYTSSAAREIVEEMRRQDMMAARRALPRHKRRHITISCSQPLALEALSRTNPRLDPSRARDDTDMERELRFPSLHHPLAPDVVRSTIGQSIRINDKTIDRLFCAPDKIVIPERYVPEQQVEEIGEEEKQKRIRKTESIRRMLTGSASVQLPRPPSVVASNENVQISTAKTLLAKERQQRSHFLGLNQVLVEEIKEKSKMVAAPSLSMESPYVA